MPDTARSAGSRQGTAASDPLAAGMIPLAPRRILHASPGIRRHRGVNTRERLASGLLQTETGHHDCGTRSSAPPRASSHRCGATLAESVRVACGHLHATGAVRPGRAFDDAALRGRPPVVAVLHVRRAESRMATGREAGISPKAEHPLWHSAPRRVIEVRDGKMTPLNVSLMPARGEERKEEAGEICIESVEQ